MATNFGVKMCEISRLSFIYRHGIF